jgi:phage shock protein PspC (stress-responsive transcriptional regulator)
MKILIKLFRFLLVLITILILGFVAIIVYALISDYKPKAREEVFTSNWIRKWIFSMTAAQR